MIIRLMQGGLGNQMFQLISPCNSKVDVYIFFDGKRKFCEEIISPSVKKKLIVFNNRFLRKLVSYFWKDKNGLASMSGLGAEVISGYGLENLSKENLITSVVSQNISLIVKDRVVLHLRGGDYIDLNRNVIIPNIDSLNLECGIVYVCTDEPKLFSSISSRKHEFKLVNSTTEVEDWLFLAESRTIVCANSTFSVSAALVNRVEKEIYIPKSIKDVGIDIFCEDCFDSANSEYVILRK